MRLKNERKFIYFVTLMLLVISINANSQVCSTVDDFTVSNPPAALFSLTATAISGSVTSDENIANVLGQWRHLYISDLVAGSNTTINILDNSLYAGGLAAISQSATTISSERLQYNANGAGLNTDFSQIDSVRINYLQYDAGFAASNTVRVTIVDSGANSAFLDIAQTSNPNPHFVDFDIASFTNIGALDLTDIDDISIDYLQSNAADVAITSFQLCSTPAPTPVPLDRWAIFTLLFFLVLTAQFGFKQFSQHENDQK